MPRTQKIAVLSDVHYACAAEQARGHDFEYRNVKSPFVRRAMRLYRHHLWLRNPLAHNSKLDQFIEKAGSPDWVVANGDYSCDSGFTGLSDDAAMQSARECLGKLTSRFGERFRAIPGDHEFGKMSFAGGQGGMRLESWRRAQDGLGLKSIWRVELGRYVLLGITSSLVTVPLLVPDMLAEERDKWFELAGRHLQEIDREFDSLQPGQRMILFCHDPSALSFLRHRPPVDAKLPQVEQTIVGHLHSRLVFFNSQLLSGMPPIGFLGPTAKRLSTSLSKAKDWRPFNVRLCPSLSGIELLKDGGFYTIELDEEAGRPAKFTFHRIRW